MKKAKDYDDTRQIIRLLPKHKSNTGNTIVVRLRSGTQATLMLRDKSKPFEWSDGHTYQLVDGVIKYL